MRGPDDNTAVAVYGAGARLELQGLAIVEASRIPWAAVKAANKGRAELSGCTLTSTGGAGLNAQGGATATMDGGRVRQRLQLRCLV